MAPKLILGWADAPDALRAHEQPHATPVPFYSTTIPLLQPVDLAALQAILGDLPASIHRTKGFVADRANGRTMLVRCVDPRWTIAPYPHLCPPPPAVLVAIGTDRGGLDCLPMKLAPPRARMYASSNGAVGRVTPAAGLDAASDPVNSSRPA